MVDSASSTRSRHLFISPPKKFDFDHHPAYAFYLHGNLCLYNHQGHLQDAKEVAVKRLIQHFHGDKSGEAFMREVEVMSKLRHGNLLQLLFYCQERNERILVYEFMQNNSLNLYIFGTPLH
jgi:serine/threonine protein kinase